MSIGTGTEVSKETFVAPNEQRFLIGDVVALHYTSSPNPEEQHINEVSVPDYLGRLVSVPQVTHETTDEDAPSKALLHISQVLRSKEEGSNLKRSADIIVPSSLSMQRNIHFALHPLSNEFLERYVAFFDKLKV